MYGKTKEKMTEELCAHFNEIKFQLEQCEQELKKIRAHAKIEGIVLPDDSQHLVVELDDSDVLLYECTAFKLYQRGMSLYIPPGRRKNGYPDTVARMLLQQMQTHNSNSKHVCVGTIRRATQTMFSCKLKPSTVEGTLKCMADAGLVSLFNTGRRSGKKVIYEFQITHAGEDTICLTPTGKL